MNKEFLLSHLKEAKEELDRTILQIENQSDFDSTELQIAMSHVYHHLNTAWNGRTISSKRQNECSQNDFDTLRKFPSNEELLLL